MSLLPNMHPLVRMVAEPLIFGFGENMENGIHIQFARALARDVVTNPTLMNAIDYLVAEALPEQAAEFMYAIKKDLANELMDSPVPALFPRTRALFRELLEKSASARAQFGLGWIAPLLTAVLPALTSAATSVYTTRVQVKAQKDIAEIQVAQQARETEVHKELALARMRQAELAIRAAANAPMPGLPTTPGVAPAVAPKKEGVPKWVLPAAVVGGAGLLLYLGLG